STGDFLKALRTAVDRGLSRQGALRALTTTPAEMLGVADQLGTIQKGRLAGLVITDGDIFDKKTKVLETWVQGTRYQHEDVPVREVTGDYELTLQHARGLPATLYLSLTRNNDGTKLSGRLAQKPSATANDSASASKSATTADEGETEAKEPAALDLVSVSLADAELTGRIRLEPWNQQGIARLSLLFAQPTTAQTAAADSAPAAIGTIDWPDGTQSAVRAQRRIHETAEPTRVTSTNDNDATDNDAIHNAPSAENKTAAADEQKNPDGSSKEDSDKSDQATPASFPVNYPLGAFGRTTAPEQSHLLALTHATLWTCGPEGTIEDGTLLIADGRILAVGREVPIPPDATVIDLRGMHLSPGIIDCHSHMATDGGVNEATQAITCEVRVGDFVDADDITIYRQLAGGVTSSNILHGSANPIGGQNQVIKLRWGQNCDQLKFAEAPPGVKFALGENVKQSNWGEPTGRYPQTRMGVEQLFRDAFEAAKDYEAKWQHWNQTRRGLPPRKDLELEALVEIIRQKRWIH
ncbi:MAG: amidohydrolase family protein, partial [Planctomycetaceae bacterium]|nr:amidohydrolase family protein [Planctomycetaceae bacterium]